MSAFEPVDSHISFPDMERRILDYWRQARIFEKSLELRSAGPMWTFYEGPPTANGKPGIHHVEARTFKDVYPRFKTMTGFNVPRKAGWDCHGLPVEIEVEKEIGTTGKRDIEEFGIGEFTRLCRESVTRYVGDWERLTERIGFWINLDDAYWTMNTEYVESVWWSLKQLYERNLLFEADKVTAYCPRCGTALSDAEVALGYQQTEDPSVFLKLEITEAKDADLVGAKIAVWTTTPWTLLSNLGLAVDGASTYALVEHEGDRIIVAEPLREKVLGEAAPAPKGTFTGAALVGARYKAPFDNVDGGSVHTVVAADFVSMQDGTGVVHIAPAFGPDDLEIGRQHGWPVYKPVDEEGKFFGDVPEFVHGRFVKDADPHIIEDLERRGLLLRAETYEHSYPFCWRCNTPLLYYARSSWYVGTTQVKQRLVDVNQDVNWYPSHIKDGRFGNWLDNNVDWALSRERYWGTPLPIWRCSAKHTTIVSSLRELGELAGRDVGDLDPHRPAIDDVTFDCPECGEIATRLPEVIDAWYDSGAMPFAQWGYHPELGRGIAERERAFPADFISEAIDQTRGWFYTLMAEGVLQFDGTAYRNVVCLGHLIAEDGRKMSKSLGNIIDPWEVLDRHGADTLRWFLLTSGSPWASRRVGVNILDDIVRQFMLTLWNVYSFFVTYATADGFDPDARDPLPVSERPVMDRWILSQLAQTAAEARTGLEAYDATGAGRRIAQFVDDLSNWYVRRTRRRFWDPANSASDAGKSAAYLTLHECLVTLSQLLAPFTPFVAEELWQNLAGSSRPESVHLSDYPAGEMAGLSDPKLDEAMAAARAIVELGRRVRAETRMKVRQPLAEAVVHYAGDHQGIAPLLSIVAEELNVKQVVFAESADAIAGWKAKPNFKALGPRLGPKVKDLAELLSQDDGSVASAISRGETATVRLLGEPLELGPDDVDLAQETKEGWGVAADGGLTVALDLEPTRELRLEGLAREVVRLVQDARKAAGLDVSDRIDLGIECESDAADTADTADAAGLSDAITEHRTYIAGETLAASLEQTSIAGGTHSESGEIEGRRVTVTFRKV